MAFLKYLALVFTVIALIPSATHLFELPGKLDLERESYFTVQSIYAGWAMFAIPICGAILANLALAIAHWRRRDRRAVAAAGSALLITVSLVVFFTWVFPGNAETANWTRQPENWETLRRNWEYGHAADAVIVFLAFIATCKATIGAPSSSAARRP